MEKAGEIFNSKRRCMVKECDEKNTGKKHFFRFPKEHDRWLQWLRACDRLDVERLGAEYAHHKFRLCHIHFEEKWYKINKIKASIHPDATPTIFFGRNNAPNTLEDNMDVENIIEEIEEDKIDEGQSEQKDIDTSANDTAQQTSDLQLKTVQPMRHEQNEEAEYQKEIPRTDGDIQIVKP